MKKILVRIKNIILTVLIVLLLSYIIGMCFFPQQTTDLIGYRFYQVLTDSMEPVIPTQSLVLVKTAKPGQIIRPGTIVTFRVNYFGEQRVYTHYLKKIERDETGKPRYYTQGATAPDYDSFDTYREDIIGTYVFHVPSIGNIILYIKSPFFLLELAILVIINAVYYVIWKIFDTEERLDQSGLGTGEALKLKGVDMQGKKNDLKIKGSIYNSSKENVDGFTASIAFLGKKKEVLDEDTIESEGILAKKKWNWEVHTERGKEVKSYKITLNKK